MSDYKVTGVITSYKRDSSIVEQAVLSMLNQTYPLEEVLVIDDNVNDSEFCRPLKDMCAKYQKVRYIKQDGNKGACAARNLGIKNAVGDFVGFLDDDDEWMAEKIEKQVAVFKSENSDKLALVFCRGIVTDENGNYLKEYNSQFKSDVSYHDMFERDYVGSTSQPLIKKSVFDDVGGFWEEQPARQDYEMWIRISQKYALKGIPDKLFIHKMHEGEQISKNKKKIYNGLKNIYERYYEDIRQDYYINNMMVSRIYHHMYNFSFYNVKIVFKKVFLSLRMLFRKKSKN